MFVRNKRSCSLQADDKFYSLLVFYCYQTITFTVSHKFVNNFLSHWNDSRVILLFRTNL